MATPTDAPAPLRLPAILQNPISSSQRQIEAHNAQQREKLAARREAKSRTGSTGGGRAPGIGKRVVRRSDNAAFLDNPHIVAPRRTDLYPSVPLHPRPTRASFPPQALDRSTPIPGVPPRDSDPFSDSSVNGAFTTSLKGTRALLRKRGQRAEGVVGRVEAVVRGWLGGDWGTGQQGWKVVDEMLVDLEDGAVDQSGQAGQGGMPSSTTPFTGQLMVSAQSRRLPPQHRVTGVLPALPTVQGLAGLQVAAVLELSRSVAHLTLAAMDPFDRLVIHLLARYYECLSWSEEHLTSPSRPIRLTHLIIPSIARPRPTAASGLLTPDTTDISDLSGLSSSDASSSDRASDTDGSETETETERGTEVDPDETYRVDHDHGHADDISEDGSVGYSLVPGSDGRGPGLASRLDQLHLHRVDSASSSAYASSEAESENSSASVGAMGDSMTLFPPIPPAGSGRAVWLEGDDEGSEAGYGASAQRMGAGNGLRRAEALVPRREVLGWADKPTFFEYLYGA